MITQTPCQCSRWLHGHTFFTNIITKTKKFTKLFSPVQMGPRSNLLGKTKLVINLSTLSLSLVFRISFGLPFFQKMCIHFDFTFCEMFTQDHRGAVFNSWTPISAVWCTTIEPPPSRIAATSPVLLFMILNTILFCPWNSCKFTGGNQGYSS